MYTQDAVQLYPRTTMELMYCLLLACGFAIYYAARSLARSSAAGPLGTHVSPGAVRFGVLAGLLLLIASMGSSIGDRYMPRTNNSTGLFAFLAQLEKQPNGGCSAYAATWGYGCPSLADPSYGELIQKLEQLAPRPGELPHPQPAG
jgi:galactan 5-O-arabinofuranosyltransferase